MRVDPSREVNGGQPSAGSSTGLNSRGVTDLSETCFHRLSSVGELRADTVRTINAGFAERLEARDFSGAVDLLESYRDKIIGNQDCPSSIRVPYHLKLAYAYMLTERLDEAEGELLQAGKLCQNEPGAGTRYLVETLDRLAFSALLQGRPDVARNQYRLAVAESSKHPNIDRRVPLSYEYDELLFNSNRRADAVQAFRGLVQDLSLDQNLSESSMWPQYQTGKLLWESGSPIEGEKYLRAAHLIALKVQSELDRENRDVNGETTDPALIEIQGTLIELLMEEGRIEECFPLLVNQIEVLERLKSPPIGATRFNIPEPELDERIVKPAVYLALAHMVNGRISESGRALGIAHFVKNDQEDVPSPVDILLGLAAGYSRRENKDLAFASMRLALTYIHQFH